MKKAFLILSLTMFCYLSIFLLPQAKVKQVDAAFQFAIPAAGVGAYAGGAILLGGLLTWAGSEYGEEISRHGEKLYDRLASTTKNILNSALGGGATTQTSFDASDYLLDIKDFNKNRENEKAISHTVNEISRVVAQKEIQKSLPKDQVDNWGVSTIYPLVNQGSTTSGSSAYTTKVRKFDFNTMDMSLVVNEKYNGFFTYWKQIQLIGIVQGEKGWGLCGDVGEICLATMDGFSKVSVNLGSAEAVSQAMDHLKTVESLLEFFGDNIFVVKTKDIPKIEADSEVMVNTVVDNIDDVLGKGGQLHFPSADSWTGIDAVGNNVGWNIETGSYTTSDGVPAVMPVTPSIPYPKVVDGVIAAPVGDGSYVDVGTGTIVGEAPVNPPIDGGGDGGILQGLWDWLKGILQSILDAIKALAGLLGILALIEGIKSLVSSIASGLSTLVDSVTTGLIGKADNIQWEKLKTSGTYFTTKFPFSLPWDVGRALSAVFGDFFTNEVPSWTMKIKDWQHELTFPQEMVKWMPYLKGMLLVMFDITLIYSVRKLLGGAQ